MKERRYPQLGKKRERNRFMTTVQLIITAIKALGGTALFLYGMQMLGTSLEKASGGQMEKILRKLTGNILKSVLLGTLVTACIQSSGATTVIVVGLVNAGIMSLGSAVGVIMGANIGTTITGQILRLAEIEGTGGSVFDFLDTKVLAPMFCIAGLALSMLFKKGGARTAGEVFLGIGVLFMGMNSMTEAVAPLSELPAFTKVFTALSNPILGILAGALVTVLLQSSSAAVGILQAISLNGYLPFSSAFPIIMGSNIGTCVTPLISAVNAEKNAKRAAVVHIYFNILGTVLFLSLIYALEYTVGLSFWQSEMTMGSIANFHTVFNVTVTLVLLPLHNQLEKLAVITIKDKPGDEDEAPLPEVTILDDRILKSPAFAIQQAKSAVLNMAKLSSRNFEGMRKLFTNFDEKAVEKMKDREECIDRMEDNLNEYLVKLTHCELTEYENRHVTLLLHLTGEFERIGDYTMNLIESAERLRKLKNMGESGFSDSAMREFNIISDAAEEIIGMACRCAEFDDITTAVKIEPLEEVIDYLNETLKARHIERLKTGKCVVETGINFLDLLVNLERISDHCSNIAVYVIGAQKKNAGKVNRHEYISEVHKGEGEQYMRLYSDYMDKYALDS